MYKKPPKPSFSSPFIDLPVKKEWPKNYILHTIWDIGPCHQTRRLLFLTFSHQQKSSKQYFGNTGTAFITNMNIITNMLYLVIMFLKNCWTSQGLLFGSGPFRVFILMGAAILKVMQNFIVSKTSICFEYHS